MNVLSLIQAAGPLLWVLLALSIYTIYLTTLRVLELSRLGQDSASAALIERTRAVTAESGGAAALAEIDYSGLQTPTANVLRAGLARADRGIDAAQAAMNGAILQEDARLYAGISALGTVAQIAPLIGLLGTVIGMVRSFIVFSQTTAPTPSQLATGISEALINTAGGLIVAIVAYVARNALRSRADRIAAGAERVREELPAWLSVVVPTAPVRAAPARPAAQTNAQAAPIAPLEFTFEGSKTP
ncbi:MotA/TolQ/ExbB proton channel family protein [Deinococcus psychrotolerans]|uniref:MotA/TolQ/ExbB proton channel family protein n=2 Tax=Deinococcus TaxID=1298 RepID=A0A553V0V8_9DEIO|nr:MULTISPECIES: MotA/TolQ/ExbB proton channel family protein [Deinococcus]AZI42118.1 MotA/TolQ/ExbB proton channel family protein [Deinococcus psychrotolerans]TSA86100.1 MotA/TolQ/ExbB proton channel family protein [Deinococcus detaillensis]